MERLTARSAGIPILDPRHEEKYTHLELIDLLVNRLTLYEDTGLPPGICAEYKKFEDEAVSKGVTFKRIVELMEEESARKNPRPLTEEELRGMIGEPVWMVSPYVTMREGRWEIVDDDFFDIFAGDTAYRYKPEEEL